MLLGVISDTHIPAVAPHLPADVIRAFRGVDAILHAGDAVGISAIRELAEIAPVEAVSGNMDPPELQAIFPSRRIFEAGVHRIGIIHGAEARGSVEDWVLGEFQSVSAIVFGHTHRPYLAEKEGILLMNPGSPTARSGSAPRTVGKITVSRTIRGEIITL